MLVGISLRRNYRFTENFIEREIQGTSLCTTVYSQFGFSGEGRPGL